MNDDAFNLTPLDIRKQEFRKTLRGYDTNGVEDFRVRVADALERGIRERQVLEERAHAHPLGDLRRRAIDRDLHRVRAC